MRIALGVAYRGQSYQGWQSQPSGQTVQDVLEHALSAFAGDPAGRITTICAGRTDAGVHAFNQVVHFDTELQRERFSWVRGTNRFLPGDVAVQWCQTPDATFHARNSARGRRYRFVLLESPVRPALEQGLVGWVFRPLDGDTMRAASQHLLGEHDFTSFRAANCQSPTPVKTLRDVQITHRGEPMARYWRFDFDANAFLYHMVRNIMGCLIVIGQGFKPPQWMAHVLAAKSRDAAAPTFQPDGLYFVGPYYDDALNLPRHTPAMDWLP